MASPGGVQAGRLAPGLENPILEAGPNYYIFLYAPYTARTHFGSGGYGTTLGGSDRLPARAWAWARAWAPGPGGWLGYASCLWAWPWPGLGPGLALALRTERILFPIRQPMLIAADSSKGNSYLHIRRHFDSRFGFAILVMMAITPLKVLLLYIPLHMFWHGASAQCLCIAAPIAVLWWKDVHVKREWCQVLSAGMIFVIGACMEVPTRMLCLWFCLESLRPTLGKRAAAKDDPEWRKKKCLRSKKDLEPYNDYLKELLADDPNMDAQSMRRRLEHDKQETVELAAIRDWHTETLATPVAAADLGKFYGDWLREVCREEPDLRGRPLIARFAEVKGRKVNLSTIQRFLDTAATEAQAPHLSEQECFDKYADWIVGQMLDEPGISRRTLSERLLQTHRQHISNRAMQRVMDRLPIWVFMDAADRQKEQAGRTPPPYSSISS